MYLPQISRHHQAPPARADPRPGNRAEEGFGRPARPACSAAQGLTELYREAGLEDIGVEARAGVYRARDSRRTVRAELVRSMRPMILEMGLADERELDELDRAVRGHLDDPRTLVMPHLSFLAWGRKPAAWPSLPGGHGPRVGGSG